MATYFDVFNIKSDLQLNNVMNNLELSSNEMFALDDIINDYSTNIKEKRNRILEMFSGTNNYNYCRKLFLKEGSEDSPQQLNMNQTIELNKLFELASEKFKKVNCSQQFYQLLTQKTSKNIANAFFNMLKSIPEDSDCRFDPELNIGGQNFAQTIYPYVNELTTFLNGCKSESKKEEVKESIETQPDMFGGPDTYYKDGIEALDFDNVLDAMEEIAPDMDFVQDSHKNGKYSMIFQPNSSAIQLNQNGYKKIKKFMEEKFGKENIAVRLAHSQYAPEIKKLYVTFINQIDVQDELNESEISDTLESLKYHISVTSDKKTLEDLKEKFSNYFNKTKDTEDRNKLSEIISLINSKLNNAKPRVDECCDLESLLEPFKATVVNITVNDDGCMKDCEKEIAANSMKALASHINDEKDCCEENNIENMQTINTLLATIANYFHTKLCESQSYENGSKVIYKKNGTSYTINKFKDGFYELKDSYSNKTYPVSEKTLNTEFKKLNESQSYEKYNDIREELNDIKQDYLNNELDVYDATNAVDNLIGNKSEAEAIVDSWDDPSKHGLYGITYDEELDEDKSLPSGNYTVVAYDIVVDDYFEGEYNINEKKVLKIHHNANTSLDEEIKEAILEDMGESYNGSIKVIDYEYQIVDNVADKELDEDTVYDHSWYEVKGQKYPKRTKNGVEIKEGIKDWFKKDNRKYRIEMGSNGACLSKDKKHIVGDKDDALIISGYKKALKLAKWLNDYEGTTIYHPVEINPNEEIDEMGKSENYVLNDILKDLDKYLDDNNIINTEDVCDVIEKNMRKNNIPDELFDDLFAEVNGKLISHDILMTDEKLNETCSAGATCAGAVATVPTPTKPRTPKKKHKKSKVDEMALNMFKRHIIEDINSQIDANGNHYEYNNGFLYINGNIAKTKSKYQMLEALDEMIELDTLKGFNSNEMLMLEDIEASGSVGNEDDSNQDNNNNSNNNADNNNNQQNANQTPNQDNLGDVNQNVTQDSDLTPQQRQLKKDTEQVLDQSMSSNTDTNVTLNQGMDNNNDQATNNQTTSTNNVKYKVIGKDDSDSNNIKYIIQDPNSKETQIVDATKLRLEK